MLESNGQAWHDMKRRNSSSLQQHSPLLSPRPTPPSSFVSVTPQKPQSSSAKAAVVTANQQYYCPNHAYQPHHHYYNYRYPGSNPVTRNCITNHNNTSHQQLLLQCYGSSQHSNSHHHIKVPHGHNKKRHYYTSGKPVVAHQHRHHSHHLQHGHSIQSDQDDSDDNDEQDATSSITSESITSCSSSSSGIQTTRTNSPIPKSNSNLIVTRKRRGNLPKSVTAILKQWLIDHCRNPYPTEVEKTGLKDKTGLTLNQISNWFINARRRLLPQILDSMQISTFTSNGNSVDHHNGDGEHNGYDGNNSCISTIAASAPSAPAPMVHKKRKRASTKMEFDDDYPIMDDHKEGL